MPGAPQQLGHQNVLAQKLDPLSGLPLNEIPIPLPTVLTNAVVDSGLVEVMGRIKTLVLVVDTTLTFAAAPSLTLQLFAARTPFGVLGSSNAPGSPPTQPATPYQGSSGATSSFPTSGPNACQLVGAKSVAVPASGNNIVVGTYWFTATWPGSPTASPPTSLTELAEQYLVLGVELSNAAGPTGGSYRLFFQPAAV